MTIPKYNEIRIPALKLLSKNEVLKLRDFERPLAEKFGLNEKELSLEYESGNGRVFYDRVSWALSELYLTGLVTKPKRGLYKISDDGQQQLKHTENISKYIAIKNKGRSVTQKVSVNAVESNKDLTPQEELYESSYRIRNSVLEEIIEVILRKTPREFEKIVVSLLQNMGYGGEVKSAAEVTKYSNDKGIDGIIKEDVLGLGRIHIQAKRYGRKNSVGREEIQRFVGALAVAQSNKGVFITTSSYSKGALEYAENLNGTTTLVLIDGMKLAEYIYDFDLGMQVEHTIVIKKLDSDYWDSIADDIKIKSLE